MVSNYLHGFEKRSFYLLAIAQKRRNCHLITIKNSASPEWLTGDEVDVVLFCRSRGLRLTNNDFQSSSRKESLGQEQ